jgi:outer membrane immunogenic protein
MKLLSGILGLTLTSVVALASANAADMYRAPEVVGGYKDGPAYVGVSWSGLYFGASIGGAWSDLNVHELEAGEPDATHNHTSGVFGGGQIGYNFQRGNFVFGPEIDLGGMGLSSTKPFVDDVSKIGSGFYADATARLGYSFGRTLVYAKGGYAYFNGTISASEGTTGSVRGVNGWTAGGGVEYKLAPAWSVKAEYQYFDFGSADVIGGGDTFNNKLTVETVKAGVNYHVGYVYEPLK